MERKLETFASFSQTRKRIIEDKEKWAATVNRQVEAQRFTELLSKYNVSSVAELDEEKRTEFFTTLSNNNEDLETEGNKFGAAVKKAKEDGEEEFEVDGKKYQVEGNKFGAAVKKAKEDGEEEFEVDGETYKVEEAAQLMDEKTGKIVKLPYKTKDFRGDPITVKSFTEPHKSSSSGRIQTDQGEYFPGVANCIIVGHKFESEITEEVEINEAIQVERKRAAKKVVTQLNRLFTKKLVDLGQLGKEGMLGCVKYICGEAMTDANFHTEKPAVLKAIKGANIKGIEIKLPGLGGYHAKISSGRIKEILFNHVSDISAAAGWGGQAIVEGCALYISTMLKDDSTAQSMLNAFNAQFEGAEIRVTRDGVMEIYESKTFESDEPKCSNRKGHLYKQIESDGTVECVHCGLKNSLSESTNLDEAEVKSDEDFIEMATTIYKKAFGDKYDEEKAKEAAEGMLKKADGDYGAAIGMLQSSVG
jgi:hypothetical protein